MPMSPEAISTCCSMSSLRPCAATTASSRVGGSRRTRTGRSGSHFRLGFNQSLLNEGREMLAEPRTSDGRDSAARHYRQLSLWEAFADVEQLAALIVFVPTAPGRSAFGAPLLKALITSRELAIGTVLVMPPVVRAHDPAAGLGADLNQTVRIRDLEDRLEIAVIGLGANCGRSHRAWSPWETRNCNHCRILCCIAANSNSGL